MRPSTLLRGLVGGGVVGIAVAALIVQVFSPLPLLIGVAAGGVCAMIGMSIGMMRAAR